jgi:hypothetical protein
MEMFAHSPKGPPDVEAHRVEPEEGRQKEEVHRDGCKKRQSIRCVQGWRRRNNNNKLLTQIYLERTIKFRMDCRNATVSKRE